MFLSFSMLSNYFKSGISKLVPDMTPKYTLWCISKFQALYSSLANNYWKIWKESSLDIQGNSAGKPRSAEATMVLTLDRRLNEFRKEDSCRSHMPRIQNYK